jgi:putative oxidoreductase
MSEKGSGVNFGLLVLRLGIGVMFIFHSWQNLFDGPISWKSLGVAMAAIGISFWPTFWGFCAAATEFIGGACFAMGFAFRPACALLAFTMFVATMFHLHHGGGSVPTTFAARLFIASHALEMCIVFVSLLIIGPGSIAMDKFFHIGKK